MVCGVKGCGGVRGKWKDAHKAAWITERRINTARPYIILVNQAITPLYNLAPSLTWRGNKWGTLTNRRRFPPPARHGDARLIIP